MMKPKEYWINKGDNCFVCPSDQPLDTFYDTVLTEPHPLAIHVIEKSAYGKAIVALKELLITLADSDEIECLNLICQTLDDLGEKMK